MWHTLATQANRLAILGFRWDAHSQARAFQGRHLYLAAKHNKDGFLPASLEDQAVCHQWSFWGMTEVEKPLLTVLIDMFMTAPDKRKPEAVAEAQKALPKPFGVLNAALEGRDYLLGSLLGMFPGTLLYVYLGSLVTSATELASGRRPSAGLAGEALFGVGLLATGVATVLVTRAARRALEQTLSAARPST